MTSPYGEFMKKAVLLTAMMIYSAFNMAQATSIEGAAKIAFQANEDVRRQLENFQNCEEKEMKTLMIKDGFEKASLNVVVIKPHNCLGKIVKVTAVVPVAAEYSMINDRLAPRWVARSVSLL